METTALHDINRQIDADVNKLYNEIAQKCAESFNDNIDETLNSIETAADKLSDTSEQFASSREEFAKVSRELNDALNSVSDAAIAADKVTSELGGTVSVVEKCAGKLQELADKTNNLSGAVTEVFDTAKSKAILVGEELELATAKVRESVEKIQTDFGTVSNKTAEEIKGSTSAVVDASNACDKQLKELGQASEMIQSAAGDVMARLNSTKNELDARREAISAELSRAAEEITNATAKYSELVKSSNEKLDASSEILDNIIQQLNESDEKRKNELANYTKRNNLHFYVLSGITAICMILQIINFFV